MNSVSGLALVFCYDLALDFGLDYIKLAKVKQCSCTVCVHITAELVCQLFVCILLLLAILPGHSFSLPGDLLDRQPQRSSSPQIPLHQSHIHYSSLWLSEYERAEHQCLVFDYLLLPQSLDRMELETKFLAVKQTHLHALTN